MVRIGKQYINKHSRQDVYPLITLSKNVKKKTEMGMISLSPLVWLSLLGGSCTSAFWKNTTSHFNIHIPVAMHQSDQGYPHELAKFGSHFDYWSASGRLVERIVYDSGNPKLCTYSHEKNGTIHPSSIAKEDPPFMVLVDRGDCSFVTKVRHAQQLGASAVLIGNNVCLCHEKDGCKDGSNDKCHEELPIVADDGSGGDITIPSMLLQKSDAAAIKGQLNSKDGKGIAVGSLSWHRPTFESQVSMDYFHSPVDSHAMTLLTNFSVVHAAMKEQLKFQPHYSLLDGEKLGCVGKAEKKDDPCYELCTNNGRYCSYPHRETPGKAVVKESLRRMCLWKHAEGSQKQAYWDYLEHFVSWCQSPDFFSNEDCVRDAMKHSKADEENIKKCMDDSGAPGKDAVNALLEQNLVVQAEYGAQSTPKAFLNQLPVNYILSPSSIVESLCHAYDPGMAPHVCYVCGRCGDPVLCASRSPMECHADDGKDRENPNKKGSSGNDDDDGSKKKKGHAFRWIFIIMLFAGAGGYVYYKKFVDGDGEGGAYSLQEAFMSDDTA